MDGTSPFTGVYYSRQARRWRTGICTPAKAHGATFALEDELSAVFEVERLLRSLGAKSSPNTDLLRMQQVLVDQGCFEGGGVDALLSSGDDDDATTVRLPPGVTLEVARALIPLPKLIEMAAAGRLPSVIEESEEEEDEEDDDGDEA
jgi:hypothetical protein